VVIFDEIASEREKASKLECSQYATRSRLYGAGFVTPRTEIEFTSNLLYVLSGQHQTDVENRRPLWDYRHLFQPLPEELREDTAFLDRVHAYLPGWEIPVIAPSNYATG